MSSIEDQLEQLLKPFELEDSLATIDYIVTILQEESLDSSLKTEVLQEYLIDFTGVSQTCSSS